MRFVHFGLGFLIVTIWGFNFVVIHIGLREISPLGLSFLRFFFASIPAIFFVKPPRVHFNQIVIYGLLMFSAQMTFLFMGMKEGITAGLAPLLLQSHIFFTIIFAILFLGEKPGKWQVLGALISFLGLIQIAIHISLGHIPLLGFIFVVIAAAFWGTGNLISKKMGRVNVISLVVWGSFIAWPPLLVASLIFENSNSIIYTYQHLSWVSILAVVYIVYLSTLFGFAAWNWLLHEYPVFLIAPFTLLVPIIATMGSVLFLNEPMYVWKLSAGGFVIAGLIIILLGPSIQFRREMKQMEQL